MTHYKTLGVSRASLPNEVRDAYIFHAKRQHPDVSDGQGFAEIHEAYAVLRCPTKRQQYNAWLDEQFVPCTVCKGSGVHAKQVSFTKRVLSVCTWCCGSGVGAKK